MEVFEECGWSRADYKIWREGESPQGPFLMDVDFVFDNSLVFKNPSKKKFVGKTNKGHQVSLVLSPASVWDLKILARGKLRPMVTKGEKMVQFVEDSWKVHGRERFDYSFGIFTGKHKNIEIRCVGTDHPPFFQFPYNHAVKGQICGVCSRIEKAENRKNGKILTTKSFKKDAAVKHNGKYDYSLVVVTKTTTPVKIICPEHGAFDQRPHSHLGGSGCPECGKKPIRNKSNTSEFIKDSKKLYGDRFEYLSEYVNAITEVEIKCIEHQEVFWQTPTSHKRGSVGCKQCNKFSVKTFEQFKEMGEDRHGKGTYDYSRADFKGAKIPIEILCPTHGSFWQKPMHHTSGSRPAGCPKCAWKGNDKESFIIMSRDVFNSFYDYSKVKFVNMKTKVIIICPRHKKEFSKTPSAHCRKSQGCPDCVRGNLTPEEFEKKGSIKHLNKYRYFGDYTNQTKKVAIKCTACDLDFYQTPIAHLGGKGCPFCRSSKGETTIARILTSLGLDYERQQCFDGCVYKKSLKYDFYLEGLNLLIEMDGEQHFYPVKCFGGQEAYEKTVIRDGIKNKFAKDNEIELLRISYDENVEEKLREYLQM
jgi:hypothetical protein